MMSCVPATATGAPLPRCLPMAREAGGYSHCCRLFDRIWYFCLFFGD
uniref:Uncharacterized protein n=1 Tax=Setaria italica TaxID=4555 RepID=K3YFJ6_SETIT